MVKISPIPLKTIVRNVSTSHDTHTTYEMNMVICFYLNINEVDIAKVDDR